MVNHCNTPCKNNISIWAGGWVVGLLVGLQEWVDGLVVSWSATDSRW